MRYMLITVCEREIYTQIYETLEEAKMAMKKSFISAVNDDEIETLIEQGQEYFDNCEITEDSAWANDTKAGNWDWDIVKIPNQ